QRKVLSDSICHRASRYVSQHESIIRVLSLRKTRMTPGRPVESERTHTRPTSKLAAVDWRTPANSGSLRQAPSEKARALPATSPRRTGLDARIGIDISPLR